MAPFKTCCIPLTWTDGAQVTQKLLDAESQRLSRETALGHDDELSKLSQLFVIFFLLLVCCFHFHQHSHPNRRLQSQVDQLNREFEVAAGTLLRGKSASQVAR